MACDTIINNLNLNIYAVLKSFKEEWIKPLTSKSSCLFAFKLVAQKKSRQLIFQSLRQKIHNSMK